MKVQVSELKQHPLNERIYSLSGINSLMEYIKRLGWKEIEVHQINVKKGGEVLAFINFNRQLIKTNQELLNEYFELPAYHRKKVVAKGIRMKSGENGFIDHVV
jgi:hypothetical protein